MSETIFFCFSILLLLIREGSSNKSEIPSFRTLSNRTLDQGPGVDSTLGARLSKGVLGEEL